jgi:hypothetical protein
MWSYISHYVQTTLNTIGWRYLLICSTVILLQDDFIDQFSKTWRKFCLSRKHIVVRNYANMSEIYDYVSFADSYRSVKLITVVISTKSWSWECVELYLHFSVRLHSTMLLHGDKTYHLSLCIVYRNMCVCVSRYNKNQSRWDGSRANSRSELHVDILNIPGDWNIGSFQFLGM